MKVQTQGLKLLGMASIAAAAAALAIGLSGPAVATTATQFVSEILTRSYFEQILVNPRVGEADDGVVTAYGHKVRIRARDPSDVYVVKNTVAPGGQSGWHTHPGPSVVSVKSGTATVYSGDDPSCTGVTYPAGTGFIDEGGAHVHLVRNEGTTTLELIAFQIVPANVARRQDAANPGYCPF